MEKVLGMPDKGVSLVARLDPIGKLCGTACSRTLCGFLFLVLMRSISLGKTSYSAETCFAMSANIVDSPCSQTLRHEVKPSPFVLSDLDFRKRGQQGVGSKGMMKGRSQYVCLDAYMIR
jgi:hypothetical protein